MFSSFRDFGWKRPVKGFVWTDCRTAEGKEFRGLVARDDAGFSVYEPLGQPVALYRELAETPPTEEGILAFDNRYGCLVFMPELYAIPIRPIVGLRTGGKLLAESLRQWERAMVWLREAVRLWDLIQANDLDSLAEVIQWEGGRVDYVYPPHVVRILGPRPSGADYESRQHDLKGHDLLRHMRGAVQPGNLVQQAIEFVLELVNERADLPGKNGTHLRWTYRR